MKETLLRLALSLVKKEQIIGFVAGAIFTISASVLNMTPDAFKTAVCSAQPKVISK